MKKDRVCRIYVLYSTTHKSMATFNILAYFYAQDFYCKTSFYLPCLKKPASLASNVCLKYKILCLEVCEYINVVLLLRITLYLSVNVFTLPILHYPLQTLGLHVRDFFIHDLRDSSYEVHIDS